MTAALDDALALLDRFVAWQLEGAATPGLALALTDRERLLHVATYGYADLAARSPVTPDTLFDIASVGKTFTAVALLQERDAGRLDLQAPVARYLPWFRVLSPYPPITAHHLLSHTAGIIGTYSKTPGSRQEVVALRETVAAYPPGAHFHYSNVGYKTLGFLLEALAGQPRGDAIRERILDPLGMAATAPALTHAVRPGMATGYRHLYDDRPARPGDPLVPATWVEFVTGDGGLVSTPADLAAFVRLLLNRGRGPKGRLLSEESVALMTRRVIGEAFGASGLFYGYGLILADAAGHTHAGHGGESTGFRAVILADLDAGVGAAVLTNGPGLVHIETANFALKLLRAAQTGGAPPPLPPARDPTHVAAAADYAGVYRSPAGALTLAAHDGRLLLDDGGAPIPLERHGSDSFVIGHPAFARFPLRFGRDGDGRVTEAFHGADWYTAERYTGPAAFDHPADWIAYPGHYRSHNPWFSNFRIVLRKGTLLLIHPAGQEEALVPLDDDTFRVGNTAHSPERLRFDTIVDGQALRVNLSGEYYYRALTP